MTVQEMPRLLTTDEVADLFGCSPRTIRRLVAAGRLRAVRLSGADGAPMRFDLADLLALVRAASTGGRNP